MQIKSKLSVILFTMSAVWFLSHNSFAEVDTNVPIFIIGDSTVSNYAQKDKRRGWGQVIGSLLKNGNRVLNRARSGASSKSFIPIINKWASTCFWGDGKTKSKYGKIGVKTEIANTDTSKRGYLFIQFGHNDSFNNNYKEKTSTVPGIGNEFDHYLMKYITHAKANNLTPVLVTPMARMFTTLLNDSYFHRESKLLNVPSPWEAMNGKVGALKMAEFIRELDKEADSDLYAQFKPIQN